HIRQHGGDPQKSLAALSSARDVRAGLEQLGDADLVASLTHLRESNLNSDNPLAVPLSTWGDSSSTSLWKGGESTNSGSRFRIIRPHARGGLGAVFVAVDAELNREVALKQIQDQYADFPESRSRFVLEAEITGALEHPGIVPVYSLGHDHAGRPF